MNKENFDEKHDEKIIHLSMRCSYYDIVTIIDNSPNLQAIQVSPSCQNYLCRQSQKLLYSKKIIILSGYMQSRSINYDNCVVVPTDIILHARKYKKLSDEEICSEYRISMELFRYIIYDSEYESIKRNNRDFKENMMNKINELVIDIENISKEFMGLKKELRNLQVKCQELND